MISKGQKTVLSVLIMVCSMAAPLRSEKQSEPNNKKMGQAIAAASALIGLGTGVFFARTSFNLYRSHGALADLSDACDTLNDIAWTINGHSQAYYRSHAKELALLRKQTMVGSLISGLIAAGSFGYTYLCGKYIYDLQNSEDDMESDGAIKQS